MNYRSLADLNSTIIANLHRLPSDIDLVVGVPRSGLLAANLFSLITNIPMTDLDSFLKKQVMSSGVTKRTGRLDLTFDDIRRILVLDDSIHSGNAMRKAREKVTDAGLQEKVLFAAVYGHSIARAEADFVFEQVNLPRVFQWNLMHHNFIERSCVNLDGVLCVTPQQQQDGNVDAYSLSLTQAFPLHVTSRRLGFLLTERSEEYRAVTEEWLQRHGIEYQELIMMDPVVKRRYRRSGPLFMANVYYNSPAILFVEGKEDQAKKIAWLSGKPVLCLQTNHLEVPGPMSLGKLRRKARNLAYKLRQRGARFKNTWVGRRTEALGENNLNSESSGSNLLSSQIVPRDDTQLNTLEKEKFH